MDTNKIAQNLKKYRKAKNLTAKQVSYYLKDNDCYVEARSIYDYEKVVYKYNPIFLEVMDKDHLIVVHNLNC